MASIYIGNQCRELPILSADSDSESGDASGLGDVGEDEGGRHSSSSSTSKATALCLETPNHWACRGARAGFKGQAPAPEIKVLHLVR